MVRSFLTFMLAGLMLTVTETGVFAARLNGAVNDTPAASNGTGSKTGNAKNAARHHRVGKGTLHVTVHSSKGRAAGHATVRVISRGDGHRHVRVVHTNRGGHATVAISGRSFVVRAKGEHGREHGSTSGGMGAGGHASVMVSMHGGRGGTAIGASVIVGHGRRAHAGIAHRHEAHGLGLHPAHALHHGASSPSASLPKTGGNVSAPHVAP